MWSWILLAALAQAPTADELWARGERAGALAAWRAALERRPADEALRLLIAERELDVHRPQAALAVLEGVGKSADRLRGIALFLSGEHARALEFLDQHEPTVMIYRIDALEALARADEADLAIGVLAEQLGDGDLRVLRLRGKALARRGDHAAAIERFRSALELDPVDPTCLFGLGQSLARTGAKEEALKVLAEHRRITPLHDQWDFARRAVDLAPGHGANHASLGDAERALGRIDRAEAAYRKAAELSKGSELVPVLLRHARLLSEDRGDVEGAIALLERAAVDDVRLVVRAGDLLAQAGRHGEAAQRFERALASRPDDASIQERLKNARERSTEGRR